MHLLPLLLSLPLLSAASVIPSTTPNLKRGYPGNVYVCSGPKYTNSCQIFAAGTSGACLKLPYNSLGSGGPDKGTICRVYDNAQCAGAFLAILVYPGVANLYVSPLTGADVGNRSKYIACTACKGDGNCQG